MNLSIAAASLTLTGCLLTAMGATAAPGDWSQQGGNAGHTSHISSAGNLNPRSVRALGLQFSSPIPQPNAGLTVVGGVVYEPTADGRVDAVSATTGRALWAASTCDSAPQAQGPYADSALAVGSGAVWSNSGSYLSGISLSSHLVIACVPLGSAAPFSGSSPTLYGGQVFVGNGNRVYAVDATTGKLDWSVALPAGAVTTTVAVDGGLVLVPAANSAYNRGWVYALRTLDGSPVWTHPTALPVTGVAVSGGRVFIGGQPAALDEPTGQLLWSRTGYFLGEGVSVDGTRVYIFGGEADTCPAGISCDGSVHAFDAVTGKPLWHSSIASEGQGVVSVGGGVVYVSDLIDFGLLYMLNASSGAVIAHRAHPGGFFRTQPVVVNGSVYLISNTSHGAVLDRWAV